MTLSRKKKINSIEEEAKRIKALKGYSILDTLEEEEFDRFTELASIICDTPISLVSLVDEERQWFKSKLGLNVRETHRDMAFCHHAIMDEQIFEVEDATKDPRFKDNPLVTSDPNIRFYAGCPLIDPDGHALGTLCVINRVPMKLSAAQMRALELLAVQVTTLIVNKRQVEELKNFERLFEFSDDLICLIDNEGLFQKVSPSFERKLGWPKNKLIGSSFLQLVHPEDLQAVNEQVKQLNDGLASTNFTYRFKTKTKHFKNIQWALSPEPLTGNIFAIGRDVTEEYDREVQLKISEQRLRSFFENSQGLMCTHDLDGKFLSVNEAGAKMLGYSSEELKGMGLFDIVDGSRQDFLKEYLKAIKQLGRLSGQMVTRHRDGSKRIWMYNNVLEQNPGDGEAYVIGNAIDITERFELEEDLRHTKVLLEQTNRVSRLGGWEYDLAKQKLTWSAMTREIHQVGLDFVPEISTAIDFHKPGESREKITVALQRAIEDNMPWDLELQIITNEGKEIWVRSIGNTEFENGKCKRLFGTFQDIDKSKGAQLELDASRKLLDDVLDAAFAVSIIATDKNGMITLFNTGAEKMLGYSATEMVGKQTPAMIHLPSEIEARAKVLSENYRTEITGIRVFTYKAELEGFDSGEWTYVRKDGEHRTVSLVITTIKDNEGNVKGFLGIANDITDKKETEQALAYERARLAAFVQHAPAAIAMLDNNMTYIAASNKWMEDYKLFGKGIIGLSHYELFPNLGEDGKNRHKRVLDGEVIRNEEDRVILNGNENDQYLSWEMRPWYNFDGQVGGMMIFTRNITNIIEQREELKIAKQAAEQANLSKSEFLANMSHEIRTPLNGVIGFTDLVLKTKLNDTQQQYLNIVNQSANNLLSIISDILDFSKIEAGKLELDIEKVDLYELCCQATDIITFQVQAKGLEMLLNVPNNLPRFIQADHVRLKQILVNLLGNAAKFTDNGEIELRVEPLWTENESSKLRFSVRDTGIGIPTTKQEKIFNAFSQADTSTTKKYGGTGLGLNISNSLLDLMGSKLELSSIPGEGSTFYFDVIFNSEAGDPIEWEGLEKIKNVLVVDDNENNRMILSQMLLLKNITTTEARNGFEALQLLADGTKYDVILIDYHMPYMDGLETIAKIRASFYSTPEEQPIIILHSSSDDGKLIPACEQLEVSHRLIKPIKMQDIYYALTHLYEKTEIIEQIPLPSEELSGSVYRVLIADDNAVNRLLVKTIVNKVIPNSKVLEAVNGAEAVEFCSTIMPDMVFMDIQMPEMNGYEATQKIKLLANYGGEPIIALTAGNVKGEKEKCLEAGMCDFVVKPIREEIVINQLSKWMFKNVQAVKQEEPKEMDNDQHFNLDQLRNYTDNDSVMIAEFLLLIEKELTKSSQVLLEAIQQNDVPSIKGIAHKLYGTATTGGMNKLTSLVSGLSSIQDTDKEGLENFANEVREEINTIIKIINN